MILSFFLIILFYHVTRLSREQLRAIAGRFGVKLQPFNGEKRASPSTRTFNDYVNFNEPLSSP